MNWKIIDESTSNFKPMVDGFPLIVYNDQYCKVCPECGYGQDQSNDKCEDCGADLSDVEPIVDDCAVDDIMHDLNRYAKNANDAQDFYKVSLEPGYYEGIQFYVTPKYDDVTSWSDEDAQIQFGVDTTEEVLELKNMSRDIVLKVLKQAKKELGLLELNVSARFSNGETMYDKVDEASTVTCDGCGREVHDDTVEVVGDQVLCDRCRRTSESSSDIENDKAYQCPCCGGHNCEFETIEEPEDGYFDGSTMTAYFSCNDCLNGYNVDFKVSVDDVYPLP